MSIKKMSIILLLVLLLGIQALADQEQQVVSPVEIAISLDAFDFEGKNYKNVVRELNDLGFTNVQCMPMSDLIFGIFSKDGDVDVVSINGITEYKNDMSFPSDAEIVVKYHSFPFDISLPYDSSDYYADGSQYSYNLNWTVESLVSHFEELGFNDITVKEESYGDFEYYKIRSVEIDGDRRYDKGDIYESSDSIEIVVNPSNKVLTVDNCPELAALLSGESNDYSAFAEKYDECIIEFDGHVSYSIAGSALYDPIVDVAWGDFDDKLHSGINMRIQTTGWGISNKYVWVCPSKGTNVHVIAEVDEYQSDYYKTLHLIGIVLVPQEEWNNGLLLPINRDSYMK